MNIRISKLYVGGPNAMLEVAFNADPQGTEMITRIREATGHTFTRPPANRHAVRELHLARIADPAELDRVYKLARSIAADYGIVHDSQKEMQGPDDLAYMRGGA
jgi:hypothetical protein